MICHQFAPGADVEAAGARNFGFGDACAGKIITLLRRLFPELVDDVTGGGVTAEMGLAITCITDEAVGR